jgi:trans-2,3-dihydro-3-hydroxyanthranilate isomerase
MRRHFHTLDVFTDRRFAGNPLAVVHDGAGLDTAAMQRIAREFNLSETVFVLPAADTANTAAMRIFTPGGELPFAGHPTIGTAVILAATRAPELMRGGLTIALEQAIGLVRVEVHQRAGAAARGIFALPRLPRRLEGEPAAQSVAGALGLQPGDIGLPGHSVTRFAVGSPFTLVPVTSLDAIGRARSQAGPAFDAVFGSEDHPAVYLYTRETVHARNHWHARMFAPSMGLVEDPATGSAAACFAGVLAAFEHYADGTTQVVIEQGYEMGRPSEIVLDMDVAAGELTGARIGGAAVVVQEGWIEA